MENRRQFLMKAYKLYDMLVMSGSLVLAAWVSFYFKNGSIPFQQFFSLRVKVENFVLLMGFFFLWHAILGSFKLYHSKRLGNRWREIKDIIKATTIGTFALCCMAILFKISMINELFIVIFWSMCTSVMISTKLILRLVLKWLRIRGRNLRFMLIAGTNQRALDFARKIESKPELGYRLAGFVDFTWDGFAEFEKEGYEVVADVDDLPSYLKQNVVDEIFIALPLKSHYDSASRVAALCNEQGIIVRHLPGIFEMEGSSTATDYFEGEPLITNYTGTREGWQIIIKRFIDIVISAILLVILTPLFFAIGIVIRMNSAGPAFFVQDRVGLNKRRFRLYKLRTMFIDAEQKQCDLEKLNEMAGPAFKIANDPRITSIGRFLRKASIDELPQLINVFKGDMSLVGPRPLPIRDYKGFDEDWYHRRFSVRPGITCLWQIRGRSNIPFEKWIEMDLKYIDQWSLLLDLKILVRTIPAVIKGVGAV